MRHFNPTVQKGKATYPQQYTYKLLPSVIESLILSWKIPKGITSLTPQHVHTLKTPVPQLQGQLKKCEYS